MHFSVDNLIPQDYNKPIIQAERSDSDDKEIFGIFTVGKEIIP